MLQKFFCFPLEKSGLIVGIFTTIISLIFFCIGTLEIGLEVTHKKFFFMVSSGWHDELLQTIVRRFYFGATIVSVLASILVIVGILMRNKWLLVPWTLITMMLFAMTCFELMVVVMPSLAISAIVGALWYLPYSIICLYFKMESVDEEEKRKQNAGVRMVHVENPVATTPYATMDNDK